MMAHLLPLLGMAGVSQNETHAAHQWQRRLHWVMLSLAILVIPAFYLHAVSDHPLLRRIGAYLDWIVVVGFTLETVLMTWLCRDKWHYLIGNWLNLLIILASVISLLGVEDAQLLALARLLRIATIALLFTRVLGSLSTITPRTTPFLLVLGIALMALAGAGFYWLEPSVHSYAEGLWLAFESGATVGYGDLVPTTEASRFFAVIVVVIGFAMLSLVTASITAFFIGKDETRLRQEMHQDIRALRTEIQTLREEMDSLRQDINRRSTER